ncbi:MAG: ABC transporter ATP-binding protein [Actinobacteria bacterium]|nr:ABC transporter ATP-binding protein [Actinomycetota bacterium]
MAIRPAVEIQGLHKSYGAIQALDDASLLVAPAQIFGLVGPNGSGKSTIIKAICGILKPDRGSVRVLGLDADRNRHAVRERLGYMPQTPSLYDDLSPAENLRFFGGGFRVPDLEGRMRTVLEFVRLWDRRDDPLYTFSGGMRQRASLACALMHDPEVLILDEPTAGVDPALRQNFWDHFAELRSRGRTIFLSTNQMDEALRCDRVAILLNGKILAAETPEAIRSRGKARIALSVDGVQTSIEVSDYEKELPRILADYGLGPQVSSISIRRQSLEEVILDLIGKANQE